MVFPTAHGIKKAVLVAMDKLLCHCATYINPEGFGVKNDLSVITSKPMHIIGHGNVRGIDLDYWKRDVSNDKTVKIVRNGFFDLNRSDVFVELCTSKSAKSAFAVFPAEAEDCVEFEICNLPRLISYDGIGDAVDFSSGSCMLASASGCKTVERGMARMEEDGFWHIIKRSQVLLYK